MKKYLDAFSATNILLITLVLLGDLFYILTGSANMIPLQDNLWIKSLTSACFVGIGIVSLIFTFKKNLHKTFAITMLVGLTLAMIGDILLEVEFIIGAIFFAFGHIGYFIAYCFLCPFKWKDLIFGGAIAIVSILIVLFVPVFTLDTTMKILILCYATVISFMLGKAISNYVQEKSVTHLLILIGSVLFFFSDLMLLFDNFSTIDIGATFGILCLTTYYPAEILLALSAKYRKNIPTKTE